MWFKQSIDVNQSIIDETNKLLTKHQGKVVVCVDKLHKSDALPELQTKKFIVPSDVMFSEFVYKHIHKRLGLQQNVALFYFLGKNSVMPLMTSTMGELYEKYKDEDLRLHIYYNTESVFG